MKGHYVLCRFNPDAATLLLPTLTQSELCKLFCDLAIEIAKINNIEKPETLGHWRLNEAYRMVKEQTAIDDRYTLVTEGTQVNVLVKNSESFTPIFIINEITIYEKA